MLTEYFEQRVSKTMLLHNLETFISENQEFLPIIQMVFAHTLAEHQSVQHVITSRDPQNNTLFHLCVASDFTNLLALVSRPEILLFFAHLPNAIEQRNEAGHTTIDLAQDARTSETLLQANRQLNSLQKKFIDLKKTCLDSFATSNKEHGFRALERTLFHTVINQSNHWYELTESYKMSFLKLIAKEVVQEIRNTESEWHQYISYLYPDREDDFGLIQYIATIPCPILAEMFYNNSAVLRTYEENPFLIGSEQGATPRILLAELSPRFLDITKKMKRSFENGLRKWASFQGV